MSHWIRGLLIVALGLPAPASAATQPASASDTTLVDVEHLGQGYAELAPTIEDRIRPRLAAEGIDITRAHVRVSWLDDTALSYAIVVSIAATDDSPAVEQSDTCASCTSATVVDHVEALIHEAVTELHAAPTIAVEAPVPAPTMPPVTEPQDKDIRRLHALGIWGIGTLVLGIAAAGTGGRFLAIGESRPSENQSLVRDFRPSGVALVATGGALAIAGVTLLAIDLRRSRKRHRKHARVQPIVGPGHAALTVSGRF